VVLLSEVAELAAEANKLVASEVENQYGIASSAKIKLPFADFTWTNDIRTEPTGVEDDLTVSSDTLDNKNSEDFANRDGQCLETHSRRQQVKDFLD
jgi:hypothetical protein